MRIKSIRTRLQRTIFILGFLIFSLLLFSCKSSTNPKETHSTSTSHIFSWQKIPFSQLTPNIISVISKDDIWIAGVSTGDFSVLHWDGKALNQVALYDPIYQSVKKYFSDFVANADNDLYFADGNIFHSDGTTLQNMYTRDYDHNEFFQTLWMESPGDIYAAGRKSIIHFNGQEWSKVAVPGNDPVVDIWGMYPVEGAAAKIIGLVSGSGALTVKRLITLSKGTVKDTLNLPDDIQARQLWFDMQSPVYVLGTDLWQYTNNKWEKTALDGTDLNALHGSAWNNIFVVGKNGYAAHFNGETWKSYPELRDESGEFETVCVKGDVVAMAGRFASSSYLVIGVQQQD
jgi:hypothetical protein